MTNPTGPVLLFSPGIDSLLAEYSLRTIKPRLVHYAIASRYTQHELTNLLMRGYNAIDIDTSFNLGLLEQPSAYIPNRNLLMAMHAASYYGNEIYIGGTKSDRVSDNNPEIFEQLSELLTKSLGYDVTVKSPFAPDLYKCEIAQNFVNDHNDPMMLANTFSCYNPRDEIANLKYDVKGEDQEIETFECSRCKACFRKSVVLNSVGIYRAFNNSRIVDEYEKEFKNETNPRAVETINYIQRLKNGKTENREEIITIHNTK